MALCKWRQSGARLQHCSDDKTKEGLDPFVSQGGCISCHCFCNNCDGYQQTDQKLRGCHHWYHPNKSHSHCKIQPHSSFCMVVAFASAGDGAATFMSELGKNGNSHARWNKICDKFEPYCNRGGIALFTSFIGIVLLLIITVMSIIKLLKLNRINHVAS